MAPSQHHHILPHHPRLGLPTFQGTPFIAAEQKLPELSSEIAAAAASVAKESLLQEVSTLVRYPEPAGKAWEGPGLGIPPDPMPLKLQEHRDEGMKALFMGFQQENHENIPARGIPTGKPKEHFSSWGSSWEPESMLPDKEAGQGVEGRACPALISGPQPLRHIQRFLWPLRDWMGHSGTGLLGSQPSCLCSCHQLPCRTHSPLPLQGSS